MRHFIFILILLSNGLVFSQDIEQLKKLDSSSEKEFSDFNHQKTIEIAKEGLKLSRELQNDTFQITFLSRLSYATDYLGYYDMCQEYNFELLALYNQKNDSAGLANTYNDIGIVHYYKEEFEEALKFAFKSLEIYKSLNDSAGIAMCYNNIANSHADHSEYKDGLDYYFKALTINSSIGDKEGVVTCLGNIGETYYVLEQYDKALEYYRRSIAESDTLGDWYVITPYLGIAQLQLDIGKVDSALFFANKVLGIAKEHNSRAEQSLAYGIISDAYEIEGNSSEALRYFKIFKSLEDSIYRDQSINRIAELNAKYELSEKDNQISLQKYKIEQEKGVIQRNKWIMIILGFAILAISVVVYFLLKENKRRKETNLLLNQKNELIEEKSRDITQSILYARKIQNAILPSISDVKNSFPDSFIIYKPKDIVSGDFYWHNKTNSTSIIAAVDCTGHGVPGAFMSMMANDLLNQIILDEHIEHPSIALELLDKRVKQNLKKSDDTSESRDGLDITLCAYHHDENILEYAGAKNDLYLFRNGDIIIYKANRHSIGGAISDKQFKGENIKIEKGDEIILFTDGIVDQFGGDRDKKFSYKKFRNLLIGLNSKSMQDKKLEIERVFEEWKGENEQLDDICVIGIKF